MSEEKNRITMFKKGTRDYSVDIMRCISCFMVVSGHVSVNMMGFSWESMNLLRCLSVSATNLFLMISGIFFLSPEREIKISKIWSKNILKLATAYVVWSVIYALLRLLYLSSQPITIHAFLKEFAIEEYHLWYIPMMLGIYILVPLMRVFTSNAKRIHYVYLCGLMIGAMTINSFVAFNGYYYLPHCDYICSLLEKVPYKDICQYPFYCILGYYIYTYRPKKRTRIIIYICGILGWLATSYMSSFVHAEADILVAYDLQDKFNIGILAKNTALFVLIINGFSNISIPHRVEIFLSKLSAATLFKSCFHILYFV